ncbi:MFS transporter [Alkalicoccobacillus gibsonii]|uniref:MFS transporter n=1 Tax=Alkalicoccobacillus gibsonii TaxID=79881 RepID=UPI00351139A7
MWKLLFPSIAMIAITYAFARFSFGLFLPSITDSLALTERQAGISSSSAYLAYTVALLTSSFFIRTFGQKHVIQFAGLTAVIGLFMISGSYHFLMLASGTFIAGLGSGWASPAFSQVVVTSLEEKKRDKGNTWINSGTSFGLILSGPIALLLTEQWRLAFAFFGVVALVVLIWNSCIIPDKKTEVSKVTFFDRSIFAKAKYLMIASLIIGIGSSIFWTFSRTYLTAQYSMGSHESSFFWVIMGISGVIGGIAGVVIAKLGLRKSYLFAVVLIAASLYFITISSAPFIYLSAVLFGTSYIFMTGLFIVWGSREFSNMPAVGVSLSFLLLGIGQTVGSAVAGELIQVSSFPFSFISFSFVCLLGLLVPVKITTYET